MRGIAAVSGHDDYQFDQPGGEFDDLLAAMQYGRPAGRPNDREQFKRYATRIPDLYLQGLDDTLDGSSTLTVGSYPSVLAGQAAGMSISSRVAGAARVRQAPVGLATPRKPTGVDYYTWASSVFQAEGVSGPITLDERTSRLSSAVIGLLRFCSAVCSVYKEWRMWMASRTLSRIGLAVFLAIAIMSAPGTVGATTKQGQQGVIAYTYYSQADVVDSLLTNDRRVRAYGSTDARDVNNNITLNRIWAQAVVNRDGAVVARCDDNRSYPSPWSYRSLSASCSSASLVTYSATYQTRTTHDYGTTSGQSNLVVIWSQSFTVAPR